MGLLGSAATGVGGTTGAPGTRPGNCPCLGGKGLFCCCLRSDSGLEGKLLGPIGVDRGEKGWKALVLGTEKSCATKVGLAGPCWGFGTKVGNCP